MHKESPRYLFSYFFFLGIAVILILITLEYSIEVLLNHPRLIPRKAIGIFQHYYLHFDRNILQWDTVSVKYDPKLFYILKPGEFYFSNREFKVKFHVNHAGLRDDEASLIAPSVIVAGDSHAMGWGVEQDETFPQLLEKELHQPVLNAAIASYGTLRELLLLNRLDVSKCRALVIQYNSSDFQENAAFVRNSFKLHISLETRLMQAIAEHQDRKQYYPGKHLLNITGIFGKIIFNRRGLLNDADYINNSCNNPSLDSIVISEESAFLDVLSFFRNKLSNVTVIVIDVEGGGFFTGFMKNIEIKAADYSGSLPDICFLRLSPYLCPDDFYLLDDHLNNQGHKKVAGKISETMKKIFAPSL